MAQPSPSSQGTYYAGPPALAGLNSRAHWRNGTSAVSFDPQTFIERLAALVPHPRAHQLGYQGVLAPAFALRDLVVPKRAPAPSSHPCGPLAPNSPAAPSASARSRSTWAELLRRVFALDVLTCPHCGGPRSLIAQLTAPVVVRKILTHLGHPTEPPAPNPRAHANSSTSPEPAPFTTSSPLLARDSRRPAGPLVSNAPAPPPQRASNSSPDRHTGPIRALAHNLTDRSAAAILTFPVDDGRLQRKSSAWSSNPPVDRSASSLGLNIPAVSKVLRTLGLPEAIVGAAYLRWPEGVDLAPLGGSDDLGGLVYARMTLRAETSGAWSELGTEHFCYTVRPDGSSTLLTDRAARRLVLADLRRGSLRMKPEDPHALVPALRTAHSLIVNDLRAPTDADRDSGKRHAIFPLLAAVVTS